MGSGSALESSALSLYVVPADRRRGGIREDHTPTNLPAGGRTSGPGLEKPPARMANGYAGDPQFSARGNRGASGNSLGGRLPGDGGRGSSGGAGIFQHGETAAGSGTAEDVRRAGRTDRAVYRTDPRGRNTR